MKRLCPIILAVIIFWAPMLTTCSASSSTEGEALEVRVLETPTIDTTLSLAAVVVAFAAFFVSLKTIHLQIKHNRDEVRPILAIRLDAINMSVKIKNHGVGPAILTSMEWKNTETGLSAPTLVKLLNQTWKQSNIKSPFYINSKPFVNDPNDPDVLASQEKFCFINAARHKSATYNLTAEEMCALKQSFRGVTVTITYTDLYKSQTWTLTKDLSWLAKMTA